MNDEVRYFKVKLGKLEKGHDDFEFGPKEYMDQLTANDKEAIFQTIQDELYLLAAHAMLYDDSVSTSIKSVIRLIFLDSLEPKCDRDDIKTRFANVIFGYFRYHDERGNE